MKIIAIAALIGTISAIQISALGYQAPPKPLDANEQAPPKPLDAKEKKVKSAKPEHAVGNGAVEQSPEPPLTKVY